MGTGKRKITQNASSFEISSCLTYHCSVSCFTQILRIIFQYPSLDLIVPVISYLAVPHQLPDASIFTTHWIHCRQTVTPFCTSDMSIQSDLAQKYDIRAKATSRKNNETGFPETFLSDTYKAHAKLIAYHEAWFSSFHQGLLNSSAVYLSHLHQLDQRISKPHLLSH